VTDGGDDLRPDDASTLPADRMRIKIISALGDASTSGVPGTFPFSELRRRADIPGSDGLDHHLGKLVGQFVEETDDGYRPSDPGVPVSRAIGAGTFTDRCGSIRSNSTPRVTSAWRARGRVACEGDSLRLRLDDGQSYGLV
jgi:hypothetical protein